GEIESALSSRPGVRGAVVVVHADPALGKRLVAYVASDASGAEALRRDLSERLPAYMVPSSIMVLPALPLTANGKVDRQRLPAPEAAVAAVHEAPQTPTEQAIAAIWTRLLGVEQPGRGDDFFALGGHSLLATRVASEIASGLGRRLGIRALFEHTTLAALAAHIDAQDPDRYEAIPVAPRDAVLPLSFAQQRLWFIDQLDRSAGSAYHIPSAMRLDGPLDARALQAALDGIVARHEVLRTTFAPVEGGACQVIASASTPFDLAHHDLSHLDDDARDEAVARHAAAEERAPFDLEQGPLIRGRLLRLADEAHVLLVTQHHIVSDGWSIGVLTRELVELYDAVLEERAHRLPALPVQYADYAVWQRAHRSLESQVAYWRQALEGAPALLELPADHARPSRQSHAGGILPVSLPPALCEALHSLSRVHGTTLFMTLLAGWSALLSRLSGQDEVVVGTPVANRQRTEVEPLIGFFVNTLALRVGFDASTTVASLLDQVREHTLEAYAHQDVPFEQVVEAVQPVRSLAHSPVFQAVFALNNTARELDAGTRDLTVSALPPPHVTTQFDLTLSLSEDADGIRGIVEYASDLFEPATVQGWIDAYARLLGGMVADPATPVARLPLLDAAQRQHLLHGVHGASQPLPHASVQAAFEARVDATPDALALTGEGRQWTFDALDRAANRLAHGLREAGVGADVRVAICAPRSAGFVVAMLAVLKAGAAYVPLEVDAPAARL
ncbi:condensation domain-containing protein, partial [Marilutibacter spongiae]